MTKILLVFIISVAINTGYIIKYIKEGRKGNERDIERHSN